VHGNYLRASIKAAGLDPEHLPDGDVSTMNFQEGATKAWKDIWGSGQGIGAIDAVVSTRELVDRLIGEYRAGRERLEKVSSAY
jgi:nitronate monooxygenase